MSRLVFAAALLVVLSVLFLSHNLSAQPPKAGTDAAATPIAAEPMGNSLWEILEASGIIGLIIILLSLAAGAMVFEHMYTLRTSMLMPRGLADSVREQLAIGQLAQAQQLCQLHPSALSSVLLSGLSEIEGGWPAVEKAAEEALAEQSARLFRKVEYLSVIGNIAPMLGLLGTVIGMVVAFREVAITQGAARAADLAEGIYLALVTTIEGLVVAIPAMGAYAIFRNRVDQLMAEVAYAAQHAFAPVRRGRVAAVRRASPAPPPVGGMG